ncbi:MAG TPA: hypothetical protein VGQ41_08740 [Pyrinomonadaceae bacterium]|jgi:hypothetical protein|nr:hypothetical protein [Pyrinomonadaceae bacterium]
MKFSSNRKILIALCVMFLSGVFANVNGQQVSAGPAVGETIDLLSFQSRSGQTLAQALKQHSLAMLVLVDPNCSTCISTKENIDALRERVQKARIAYFVVMVPDGGETQKYFDFADSLKLGTESFVWSNSEVKPPASLLMMTKPSHLQVTSEGLIVEKWSGTPPKDSGQ